MIAFAEIEVGHGGIARCRRCQSPGERDFRTAESIAGDIEATAGSWSEGPGPNVSFVGAEPFAHPSLPSLIAAAVGSGCQRIRLRTDGGALASSGNAAGALQAGVRHLEVVLLGGDEASHDRLTGREGLFDSMVRGVEVFAAQARAAAAPVAITGYVPVCRHNATDLARTVAVLGSLGAAAVLVEAQRGFSLEPSLVSAALTTATVAGIALHGPAVTSFSVEPWRPAGGLG